MSFLLGLATGAWWFGIGGLSLGAVLGYATRMRHRGAVSRGTIAQESALRVARHAVRVYSDGFLAPIEVRTLKVLVERVEELEDEV